MLKILSLMVILIIGLNSCNNDNKTGSAVETKKEAGQKPVSQDVSPHTCTAVCKNGNHEFAHNEIGHTCSTACGKPHVCASGCKNDSHVYAHGEVGHYCMCTPKS